MSKTAQTSFSLFNVGLDEKKQSEYQTIIFFSCYSSTTNAYYSQRVSNEIRTCVTKRKKKYLAKSIPFLLEVMFCSSVVKRSLIATLVATPSNSRLIPEVIKT